MTTSPVPAAAARRAGVHYAFVIALLSGLAMFASFGLGRFAYGLLLPSMKSALALTYTESSLLAFASLSVYSVAAPLAGVLTARFGPRRIITLALAILSLALWGVSWAPSFWPAFVFFAVAGITSGLTAVPALGILSAWFAPHRRGLGVGLSLTAPSLSFVLLGFFVPWIVARDPGEGWRQAWAVFAGVTFAITIVVLLLVRNRPADVGLHPIGGPIVRPPGTSRGIRAVLGLRSLWLLSLLYACFGFAYVIYATFLPSFIQQDRGLGVDLAGQMWIVSGFASLIGPTAFGWLSDRIGRRLTLALLLALLGASLFALIWLPIGFGSWSAAVAYGFAGGSIVGLVAAASGDYAGPALAPAALGFASIFLGIGQTIGPLVAGPVADQTGSFVPSLFSSAVIAWVGAVVALFLPKPIRRVPPAATGPPGPSPAGSAESAPGGLPPEGRWTIDHGR